MPSERQPGLPRPGADPSAAPAPAGVPAPCVLPASRAAAAPRVPAASLAAPLAPTASAAEGPPAAAGRSGRSGAGLERVVIAARRRALRSGDREVDTGHLLHSVLESDAEALRAAAPEQQRAARLLGYLAQRSIGFGLGWQRAGEAEPRVPEAPAGPGYPVEPGGRRVAGALSRAAADALERACRGASRRGRTEPRGTELLAELLADPSGRAAQILVRCGLDPAAAAARCAAAVRPAGAVPGRAAG